MQRIHRLKGALAVVAALVGGCGDDGSYELTWTLGCDTRGAPECEVTSVRDCSAAGLDTVAVVVTGRDVTTLFPCFSPVEGPLGRGPGLAEGPVELAVSGRNAAGQTLTGPVSVSLTVPAEGRATATVDLPLPPACGNGVDDDGDGLVDLFDADCDDLTDDDEGQ